MKDKLKSRKFWVAVLSDIISITIIFKEIGGTIGVIAGIAGIVLSSISYMVVESKVDIARSIATYQEVKVLIEELKKKGGV